MCVRGLEKGKMRTKTNIMVNVIDVSKLEKIAFEKIDKKEFPEATFCHAGQTPHGFIDTPHGMYALCNEGVGESKPISKTNKHEVNFYAGHEHGGYCLPAIICSMDDTEMRELATGEKINLADFIRSFGARLDNNYESWRKTIEQIK